MEASNKVTEMLQENRDILKRMADDLLEKETIVLEDIEQIIAELRPEEYAKKQKRREAVLKTEDETEKPSVSEDSVPPPAGEPGSSGDAGQDQPA